MSAFLSSVPKLQFFDNNGNPLVGGKLFTYAAGTTTPLATYTDSTGLTPNTNPIILDSRGEANVWLTAGAYKFELKTTANALIWTVDNISNALNLSQLLANSGSALSPPYTFAADPTTGMYLQAVGQVGLSANGTPVLRSTDTTMIIGQSGGSNDVNVEIYGDFTQVGDLGVTGDITQVGDLGVTGDITQVGDLGVTGDIIQVGDLDVTGAAQIDGNLKITGALRLIEADFSSADKAIIQTSVANSTTLLDVRPNGSGFASGVFFRDASSGVSNDLFLGMGSTALISSQAAIPLSFNLAGGECARFDTSRNFLIGGTAQRATTVGTKALHIFNGTAPAGTLANGISIYSFAGEAYVMDSVGNATLFSPHDFKTNEWIFRSKHTPTGKVIKIDVERLLRFVNNHFGLDAVQEFIED
jgi:hypothetical protein